MDLSYDAFQKGGTTGKPKLDLSYDAFKNPKPEEPGLWSSIVSAVKEPFSVKQVNTFTPSGAKQALQSGANVLGAGIQDAANRNLAAIDARTEFIKNPSLKTGVKAGTTLAQASLGYIDALFAGISAPIATAQKIPVVGYGADVINAFFGALGAAGGGVTGKAVDALPIPQDYKDTIKPLAEEIGALATQIAGGGLVGKSLTKAKTELATKSAQVEAQIKQGQEVVKAPPPTDLSPQAMVAEKVATAQSPLVQEALKYKTPEEFYNKLKSLAETKMPDIYPKSPKLPEAGIFGRSERLIESAQKHIDELTAKLEKVDQSKSWQGSKGERIAQIKKDISVWTKSRDEKIADLARYNTELKQFNDFHNSLTPEKRVDDAIKHGALLESDRQIAVAFLKESKNIKDMSQLTDIWKKAHSDTFTPKTALDIQSNTKADLGPLPEVQKMNMSAEEQAAQSLVDANYDLAKEQAVSSSPTESPRQGAIFNAVKKKAYAENDIATLQELARSTHASEVAQELKAYDAFNPRDPVDAIKYVAKSRAGTTDAPKRIKVDVSQAKTEIAKTAPTKQTWADFINEITC